MGSNVDFSEAFYRDHAARYAEVSHNYIQSVYVNSSHPALKGDNDLLDRMVELVPPGARGLDAGCGSGARDVFLYWQKGYDVYGVDAVDENIQEARRLHPEIADRVAVADLSQPLDHATASMDFVLCNAVIQHIAPEKTLGTTIPELVRVLKPGGTLQFMFKVGSGVATVFDRDYGAYRSFQLYTVEEVLGVLETHGMALIPEEEGRLGGIMRFTDPKPMEHVVLLARKAG